MLIACRLGFKSGFHHFVACNLGQVTSPSTGCFLIVKCKVGDVISLLEASNVQHLELSKCSLYLRGV